MKTEIIRSNIDTYGNRHSLHFESVGDAMKVHKILAAYLPEIVEKVNGNLKSIRNDNRRTGKT